MLQMNLFLVVCVASLFLSLWLQKQAGPAQRILPVTLQESESANQNALKNRSESATCRFLVQQQGTKPLI